MIESEATGAPMGLVNWFSVHPTSMPRSNQMISGDHKGLASQMFERRENPAGTLAGQVCLSVNCRVSRPKIAGVLKVSLGFKNRVAIT